MWGLGLGLGLEGILCCVGFGSFVFRWVWGGSMVGVGVCMLLTCCLVWWGVLFGCCLWGCGLDWVFFVLVYVFVTCYGWCLGWVAYVEHCFDMLRVCVWFYYVCIVCGVGLDSVVFNSI